MNKIKISAYNNMVNLKNIYKSFEIRYDVRAARKLLGLPKTTPKTQVNKALRNLYHEIAEETYQPIYQYTLSGRSQDIRDGKIRNISFTFQSKKEYDMYPMNITNNTNIKIENGLPTYHYGNTPERFEAFLEPFIEKVTGGQTHYFELGS